jgi:signal transduction histidine kinase
LRLKAVIDSADQSIFAIDREYKYLAFNQAHADIMKKLRGIDIAVRTNAFEGIALTKETISNYELPFSGKHYKTVYVTDDNLYFETSYKPIFDEQGNVTGVAVYAANITDQINAENDLKDAKILAENAAKTKSDFLSNMSHEIRTPMNAILGMSDLLLEKTKEPESLEYVKSIKYSADNLLVIINDILDFSKIEAGKIVFEDIDFNIHERLLQLKKTFKHKAGEKGLVLDVFIDENVPAMIKGDPYRLNQILFNLVGNSIKFTSKGSVTVYVKRVAAENNKQIFQFKVVDTGIGIPASKLNSIFESFSQAYTDTTRKFGGTGLGLAITKNLTELQSGKIEIESEQDSGTTFTVEIPFNMSNATVKNKNLDQLRILVVEDNLMNQYVAKQILSKWNALITVADNGKIAVEKLSTDIFDVVLMDLQMPEMSGYEATAFIRSKTQPFLIQPFPLLR